MGILVSLAGWERKVQGEEQNPLFDFTTLIDFHFKQ